MELMQAAQAAKWLADIRQPQLVIFKKFMITKF